MASILDDLKADIDATLLGSLRTVVLWTYELIDDGYGNSVPSYVTSYQCEGIRAAYDPLTASQSGISRKDARVEIIASTLPIEPKAMDRINVESSWWEVVEKQLDPAGAMWVLQCASASDPNA